MKSYIAIDLKSFYASVECVERGLDQSRTPSSPVLKLKQWKRSIADDNHI